MKLYQEELLDHYRYPRNYGILENPDIISESLNPSCGDEVSIQAHVQNGHISILKFQGKGCVISQAAASLLTQYAHNKPLEMLQKLTKDDILALIGITLGPTRLRCALLVLEALQQGIGYYQVQE